MFARSLFSFAVLLCSSAFATVYYVSPTGNDANSGTSVAQAWRTLDRVNQISFSLQPGDQVLLQRGATFRGTLNVASNGTAAQPITIGAYGSGNQPVISGATAVTGWTLHQGNIWKAPFTTPMKRLYCNGDLMTLARYPNTGWLRNDQGGTTYLTDADIPGAAGTWTGAQVVLRSSNWSYETRQITSHTQGRIDFSNIYVSLSNGSWGFFLQNKLSELDTPGEWYHDVANGMLYFRAPNNANPNNLTIEAATRAQGIWVYLNFQHIIIDGLAMRYQTDKGAFVEGSNVIVRNCTFRDAYHVCMLWGGYNTIENCVVDNIYGTGIIAMNGHNIVQGNQISNVGMVAGQGENNWGYMGIRVLGDDCIIRNNRMQNIGYIGISVENNTLVEKNFIDNALALLNDGCGIGVEHSDGVIVQDNIIVNIQGNIESTASNMVTYWKAGFGIYFGNVEVTNTIVRRNTVSNCSGGGMHVDHTMVSTGNQIKDNTFFNNGRTQISISDASNFNGPGATPPFYVPSFNTVYSGNIFYSLSKEQLCMLQYHVNGPVLVDWGTFSNNRYFSPYNEMSIELYHMFMGSREYKTLEQWQFENGEDAGSTRSPLRQNELMATSELSPNLVAGGDFQNGNNGYFGYPVNATVNHNTTQLDNGCIEVNLPNNSQYPTFALRNPAPFAVQSNDWYRMRFSIVSPILGTVDASVKGLSQTTTPNTIYTRQIPFSPERRDVEFFFQADLTDQAQTFFVHHWTDPLYYLDNVQLHKVSTAVVDPLNDHKLIFNDQNYAQQYPIVGQWADINGNPVPSTVTLQPFTSMVMYRTATAATGTVGVKAYLGGALDWNTGIMRTDLRAQGLLPATEQYTNMGIVLSNPGATASTAVMNATGNQRIVDWVVLELRNSDAGYTVLERRAALLRADGVVVAPDGSTQIQFGSPTVGRYLAVVHRNHLGILSAAPITSNGQVLDLTTVGAALYGVDAAATNGVFQALWPGDVYRDGVVRYTGQLNDRDPLLQLIGGTVPTGSVTGYFGYDVNLDGVVKYTGAMNDRDVILTTVGGTVPTAVRQEQLP